MNQVFAVLLRVDEGGMEAGLLCAADRGSVYPEPVEGRHVASNSRCSRDNTPVFRPLSWLK